MSGLGEFDLCHSGVLHFECFFAEFMTKKSSCVKCQYLNSSYFVAVEKREVERASEFADPYTEPAANEFYR
jgi:hypothetical protein